MEPRPRVLSVGLSPENESALDYGWKRLVACGCFSTVLIIDPYCAKNIQSLQGHRGAVTIVSWAPENYYHDQKNPYNIRLASADVDGIIIIWDVVHAGVVSEFSESGCGVLDVQWIQNQNLSRDLVIVLHTKGRFVLWNTQTRTQLWKSMVGEQIASFSMDPFHLKNVMFSGPGSITVTNNFSLVSPLKGESKTSELMQIVGKNSSASAMPFEGSVSTKTAKHILNELLGSFSSERSPGNNDEFGIPQSECIQTCYHGYRKDCALLVYRREIVIISLKLLRRTNAILLDRSTPSFSKVYSCHQRDAIICAHENGSLSVYARRGLACAIKSSPVLGRKSNHSVIQSNSTDPPQVEVDDYELVAFVEGPRRSRRSIPLRFAVDRARENALALVTTDGRIQFWQLRSLALQTSYGTHAQKREPVWCLADMLLHEPGAARPPKLCLQMCSLYTTSKTDPTVCRVCPQHFLRPISSRLGCDSLVAVGNTRGGVQIWDLHSSLLWREYNLLPVPILGVEWITIASNPQNRAELGEYGDSSGHRFGEDYHLGLLVFGWQAKDKTLAGPGASKAAQTEDGKQVGINHVILLNLATGYTHSLRESHPEHPADGFVRSTSISCVVPTNKTISGEPKPLYRNPIELASVSHLGQFLALLFRGECVELWNLSSLTLIRTIPIQPGSDILAMDWYQSSSKAKGFHSASGLLTESVASSQEAPTFGLAASPSEALSESPGANSNSGRRESFIFCTSEGILRLVMVDGSNVDSTTVSGAVLQGLPASSLERITAVSWFVDLIAFGTADGYVAVRDLHNKKTVVRFTSVAGWLSPGGEASAADQNPDCIPAVTALLSTSKFTTGVRRLCFLPGSSTCTHLMALLYDSLFVWQPRDMVLVCMARFGGTLQRCLVSADWAMPVSAPSDPILCLIVGADGALRLVQAGESCAEMTIVGTNSNNANVNPDQAFTRFFGSSPIPDRLDSRTPLLVPSVLPVKIAFTIRHLLQHQPWRAWTKKAESSKSNAPQADLVPSSDDLGFDEAIAAGEKSEQEAISTTDAVPQPAAKKENITSNSSYALTCPRLAAGFNKVEQSVNIFMNALKERPELSKMFLQPSATIVERCLWTAYLFSDTYETRFWRLVANRLLPASSRYALDMSWDLLAETELYRKSVFARIRHLEQSRTSPAHTAQCINSLVVLGQHERAVSLLLETPPNSNEYSLNMYRACLLAAYASGKLTNSSMEPKFPSEVAADTYLSTVKLVATNLLSSGQVDEGVELLCLIGLAADACRYLESFDQWERSVWLAKCTLPQKEANKVIRRWAAHLSSSQFNRKDLAVLLYVLLDDHDMALQLLCGLNQYQLAARYLEACLEAGVVTYTEDKKHMYSTIFMEFCKILTKLGHHDSASYYCELAGDMGSLLKNEIDFLLT
ncbi:unnamed protein product [Calicophoron daubneyi]|uniref:WD repeat-containing protein 11 n=1 Tax=Calicophoron daubneyi TaxID=300641 RepID=A0AAV2SZB6_CALDB